MVTPMTTAHPPQINVYASLPLTVALGADLKIDPTNWRWVHCLSLPLETLDALKLSRKPYKWIRYAIGVVVGTEGVLSTCSDSVNAVEDNTIPPAESADLFYHTSDTERRKMFPIDPHIGRSRVTSSIPTSRRNSFRDEVAERDGKLCVLTGFEETACDAVHLLSHSKGDKYITTYTERRSRSGDDIIKEIDSVRNGIFLNTTAHRYLGKDMAILMTPNFAMDTSDIDYTAVPSEKRWISHVFRNAATFPRESLASGSRVEIRDNLKYPPAILFDAVYAGAVLHHFGTEALKGDVAANRKDTFHPGGVTTSDHADYEKILHERAFTAERKENQDRERDARYEARNKPDVLDMLMFLPYTLVPPNELQAVFREAREKAEAAEQRHVQEKVDAWIGQIPAL